MFECVPPEYIYLSSLSRKKFISIGPRGGMRRGYPSDSIRGRGSTMKKEHTHKRCEQEEYIIHSITHRRPKTGGSTYVSDSSSSRTVPPNDISVSHRPPCRGGGKSAIAIPTADRRRPPRGRRSTSRRARSSIWRRCRICPPPRRRHVLHLLLRPPPPPPPPTENLHGRKGGMEDDPSQGRLRHADDDGGG